MGKIVEWGTIVGLRPAEIVESVRLKNDKETFPKYYDSEQMLLQHYKFPSVFLRQTKKAYLSFVTPEVLKLACTQDRQDIPSYNAIRLACRKRGILCDVRFCRKIQGSWLHQHRLTAEEIDFLQGRTSTSVFSRHYLTPDSSLGTKVLDALNSLKKEIER